VIWIVRSRGEGARLRSGGPAPLPFIAGPADAATTKPRAGETYLSYSNVIIIDKNGILLVKVANKADKIELRRFFSHPTPDLDFVQHLDDSVVQTFNFTTE